MSNSKWTKTATSASLAILGMTQLSNKAHSAIVSGGGPLSQVGLGSFSWTLDAVNGGTGTLVQFSSGTSSHSLVINLSQGNAGASFKNALVGDLNGSNVGFTPNVAVFSQFFSTANQPVVWPTNETHYIAFVDTHGGNTPIYGWASVTVAADTQNFVLDQWYYESTPGTGICVGSTATTNTCISQVPEASTMGGAVSAVFIFGGLRYLKRRKAKTNSMVSIKRKEKVHPLTLLAMGAAGVRKWREQRDRNAA